MKTIINEQRSYEFEREKGVVYGKTYRAEREGGNDVIIL